MQRVLGLESISQDFLPIFLPEIRVPLNHASGGELKTRLSRRRGHHHLL